MSVIWELLETRKISVSVVAKKTLPGSGGAVGPTVFFNRLEAAYESVMKFHGMSEPEIATEEAKVKALAVTTYTMTSGVVVTGFPTSVDASRIAGARITDVLFDGTITVLRTDIRTAI